jgi:hypothetical protein
MNSRWVFVLLSGILVLCLSLFWLFFPLAFFNSLCVEKPCSIGIAACAVLAILGIALIVASLSMSRRDHAQTVTIAINDEAEQDAEAVETLRTAVARRENPERRLAKKMPAAKPTVSKDEFVELPKDEVKRGKVRR